MFEPKRLHPIASVINTLKGIKNMLIPVAAILFSAGRDGGLSMIFSLIAALVIVLFTFVSGILSWYRYTYRIENDEVRIEYGIFVRKKRYIPFERIQSIDLTEGILQRLFGLVKVKIETAGSSGDDEAEAVLSAISKGEASLIQDYVAAAKNADTRDTQAESEIEQIFNISTRQLVILSLTSGGTGVVISALFALLSQFDDLIPFKRLFRGLKDWAIHNLITIAFFVFIGLSIAWMIGLIITMLKYANFAVVKKEGDLIISQGLLEKKQITVPLKRIQAIRINEPIIRQLIGYGTVYIESAGGSSANEEGANVTLLPIVKVDQIRSIIGPYLPEYALTTDFTPLPKRAKRRYLFRSWFFTIPVVTAALIFLKIWGLLALILMALGSFWAIAKFKAGGWSIHQRQLSLRYRTIDRVTVFMLKNKIQSLEMQESYFQRRQDLGTVGASVSSGFGGAGGTVSDLEISDVQKIYQWYSREKQKQGSLD
ncbi:PH domain-containing protein [Neobacillus niacini]|uniref:PH domain-containing protein n=1 Tax=Neobacillus niacini TaxID=86668 RepID=UPI0021CB01B3|nr:PH domain-containing protein [Neobacillus niacini]MCM3768035.1 PH domain-containing protein [Neobacillus niacini]